jgi:DNA-binding winged helix-turn-helix (wHTH) protein
LDEIRFGDCEVDCRSHEIRKRGVRIRVQHQLFLTLTMLLTAAGDVVTRGDLRRAIWPRRQHVEFDRGINKAIKPAAADPRRRHRLAAIH